MTKVGEGGRKRITVVPDKRGPLPVGTLGAILGRNKPVGRQGLSQLIAEVRSEVAATAWSMVAATPYSL